MIRVGPARPADVDEIVALVRELAEYERAASEVVLDRDELARHLFGPNAVARAVVAETDDGAVAGFALWFRTFSTWLGRSGVWLEDLYVRPAFRRRGVATALLDAVRASTGGRVEWAVLDWNRPAHDFYRGLGAAPLEEWTIWRLPPTGRPASGDGR